MRPERTAQLVVVPLGELTEREVARALLRLRRMGHPDGERAVALAGDTRTELTLRRFNDNHTSPLQDQLRVVVDGTVCGSGEWVLVGTMPQEWRRDGLRELYGGV